MFADGITDMSKTQALLQRTHYQKLEESRLLQIFRNQFTEKRVLDIGCGQGKYLRLLAEHCAQMTGVDINPLQVDALRQQGFDVFTPGDLPARKYDVLLMSHIVEHMAGDDLVAFMDHYLPMLEEDGVLVLVTPMPGIRFWHDYTHIRPYTPQSLGMMFGILGGPVAFKSKNQMKLENIWFFRDSWRIRNDRLYYPCAHSQNPDLVETLHKRGISAINIVLAGLHDVSGGRLGALASWVGLYRKTKAQD